MKDLLRSVKVAMKRSPLETVGLSALVLALLFGFAPKPVDAETTKAEKSALQLTIAAMQNETLPHGELPDSDLRGPARTMTVTATAYNSVPEQTDDTPFTTASGTHTRHGVIAANFLPIGTRIKIPDVYGDEIFIVEDRMNPRYDERIDIWMERVPDARAFGVRKLEIEIYPNP